MNIENQIRSYLPYIDATDRIRCLKVFGIIKSELGDAGYALADEFAQSAHNYDHQWVRANFKSAKEIYGVGLLHLLARDNGYSLSVVSPVRRKNVIVKPSKSSNTIRYANAIWSRATTDDAIVADHPYAVQKDITWAAGAARGKATGSKIGEDSDCLIVPIYSLEDDTLQGVQCINPIGKKQNFGPVKGGGLILGNTLRKDEIWAIGEGWADAVSLIEWHGYDCAICSFGEGRMDEVFDLVARRFNPLEIDIYRDGDDKEDNNQVA